MCPVWFMFMIINLPCNNWLGPLSMVFVSWVMVRRVMLVKNDILCQYHLITTIATAMINKMLLLPTRRRTKMHETHNNENSPQWFAQAKQEWYWQQAMQGCVTQLQFDTLTCCPYTLYSRQCHLNVILAWDLCAIWADRLSHSSHEWMTTPKYWWWWWQWWQR